MLKYILLALAMAAVFYILWNKGLLISGSKTAMLYIGSGNTASRRLGARFASCNGTTKRVLRVKDSRDYRFELQSELSSGEVIIELRDAQGTLLLKLFGERMIMQLALDSSYRYTLIERCNGASGRYELRWD